MKVIRKIISELATAMLLFVFALGAGKAQAQTHNRAAANCMQHEAYLKETSNINNAVSCVDCYCKVCGDKKAKEKEAKRKAQELAAAKQKAVTPKTTTTTAKKTKSDEMILTAPKQNIGKSTVVKLSADDQKIIDAAKKMEKHDYLTFRSVGPNIRKKDHDNTIELTAMSADSYIVNRLRENFIIKSSLPYNNVFGMLTSSDTDKESFLITGLYVVKLDSYADIWYDLADIEGNCVFNNKDIKEITYNKTNKTYIIVKRKKDDNTEKWLPETKEEYNPVTKKITPIQ